MHSNSSRLLFISNEKVKVFIVCFLSMLFNTYAQWVNDPSLNTKLVLNGKNPQNISTVSDGLSGGFIIWQDDKTGTDKIYYTHFDAKGKPTLRADGKNISTRGGQQLNPLSFSCIQNSCIIVWQGETNENKQEIFMQRLEQNGNLIWSNSGLQLTNSENTVGSYSLYVDSKGNSYISYLAKEPGFTGDYLVNLKKVDVEGNIINSAENSLLYKSNNRKSITAILKNEINGSFTFWLENINGKSVLRCLHLDSLKLLKSERNPITISNPEENVLCYKVYNYQRYKTYIVWQQKREEKLLYHQLINNDEKRLWGIYGRKVSYTKGNKTNLQACINNNNIFVSWTNKSGNQQKVYLQRFDEKAASYWNDDLLIADSLGNQFGQKMMIDNKGGIITAWFQKNSDSVYADIHSTRISANGEQLWEMGNLGVGTHFNSHKSYLSLIPDNSGGAVCIFKDNRSGVNGIYGQRIFGTGTFVSQLVGFSANAVKDSVNISWYSVNEGNSIYYLIERMNQPDSNFSEWKLIDSISSSYTKGIQNYTIADSPGLSGTLYYRVVQKNFKGEELSSEITRVNYFNVPSEIIVAQNIPNPFSDSTKISFYLPSEKEITLRIFNSSLEKIYEINKKPFPEGENDIYFSANDLEPGIYFYKFKTEKFVDVKKMVITNK